MPDVRTDGNLVDLFADASAHDPYPHYSKLRSNAPAFEHPFGFWMLTRSDDVSAQQKAGHWADEPHPDHPAEQAATAAGWAAATA